MAQNYNSSTGSGGAGGAGFSSPYSIDSSLEPQTRSIFFRLNGCDVTEAEWDIFFGRATGGMSSETDALLRKAHDYAKRAGRTTSGGGAGAPGTPRGDGRDHR